MNSKNSLTPLFIRHNFHVQRNSPGYWRHGVHEMDDADKATDLEEARTAATMAKIATQLKTVNLDPYCEDCGKLIPAKRREAVPYATRCILCQEADDKVSKGVRRL